MKELGFGLIGCGTAGRWHIQGIKNSRGARLRGVAGIRERGEEFPGQGVPYYTDYRKMLADSEIDIISITTPSSLHAEQAIACARAGKHVLVEKPLATTLADAERVIAACRQHKVKLGVIFQRRFLEPFISVKKAVEGNELGKIVLADVYVKYHRSPEYYSVSSWKGRQKFDGGGALINQSIHLLDLLCWFMGEVKEVFSYAATLTHKIEVEDTLVSALRFKNGGLGIIEAATSVYPADISHRLELNGDRGSIMLEGESVRRWTVAGRRGRQIDKIRKMRLDDKEAITGPAAIKPEGHLLQIQDMADAVREDRPPAVSGEEGKKALEVVRAIYRSARRHSPVKLPLETER